jgi:hypothetical protein
MYSGQIHMHAQSAFLSYLFLTYLLVSQAHTFAPLGGNMRMFCRYPGQLISGTETGVQTGANVPTPVV